MIELDTMDLEWINKFSLLTIFLKIRVKNFYTKKF